MRVDLPVFHETTLLSRGFKILIVLFRLRYNASYLDIFRKYAERHQERMPEDAPEMLVDEQLARYVESGGQVDGVVWYFWSSSKSERARVAAREALDDDTWRSRHCHFRFGNAATPTCPSFDKWEKQEEQDRLEDLRRRRAAYENNRRAYLAQVRLTDREVKIVLDNAYQHKK